MAIGDLGPVLLVHVLQSYVLNWVQDSPLTVESSIVRQIGLIAVLAVIRHLARVDVVLASHPDRCHLWLRFRLLPRFGPRVYLFDLDVPWQFVVDLRDKTFMPLVRLIFL